MDQNTERQIIDVYRPGVDPVAIMQPLDQVPESTDALEQESYIPTFSGIKTTTKSRRRAILLLAACTVTALGLLAALYIITSHRSAAINVSEAIQPQTVSLSDIGSHLSTTDKPASQILRINGDFAVTNSITILPSDRPNTPREGQLYYDQLGKYLSYYNGADFITVGGGGSTTNITNIGGAITNITNSTGGSSISLAGTPGALALITAPGELGGSMIQQQGATLNTGSGAQTVTLGSTTGSSTAILQAGTGGLTVRTGTAATSSGSIDIRTGDSTTTASGNISIDTGSGIIDGLLVKSLTFENGTDSMQPWTGVGTTALQSSSTAHSGSFSLALTGGPFTAALEDNNTSGIPVVAGHHYYFSMWVRAATTPAQISSFINWTVVNTPLATTTDSTGQWTQISGTGIAPAGATHAYLAIGFNVGTTQTHYFDDFTATDLSSSTAISSLNIGATNAQFVTLGNMNEIGLTNIFGGSGIKLDSGVADLNINGGAITLTGSGASTLATTKGALTLASATATSWGVSTANTGNGGDLTLHAGNAAFGSANGGNLILQSGASTGVGTAGSVVVRPQSDSALAFQLQDSASNAILTADTVNHSISIVGTPTAFATLILQDTHARTVQTVPPTISTPANCGTGATATLVPGATDTAGSFTITTGTNGGATTCTTTITFESPYSAVPKAIILQPRGDTASVTRQIYPSGSSASSFTTDFAISAGGANNSTYSFSYLVME